MIITIVADVLGQANNGTTITCLRLINGLKALGHTVKVVSPLETKEDGYYTLPKRNFFIFNNYVAKNGVELAKPKKVTLKQAIKGSDIVHVMLPFKTGIKAMKIAHKMNIPVTGASHCQAENVTAHLKMQNFELLNDGVYKRFYLKFYRHIDYIHCPSEFIKSVLEKNGYKNHLVVISNGVADGYRVKDVKKPEDLKDKICILTIGRLAREKRHDLLIDAINLSRHKEEIQLIIAGRGPLEEQTKEYAKSLTNKPIIGFYNQDDLVDIINYSDIYVHPADIEIEAISCLEAISCGLVPIISDSDKSATNHFALHDEDLFVHGSATDLARRIDYLIEHPLEKAKLREEYLEYAKQFRIENCIKQMEQMFKDAIKDYHK